MGVEVVQWIVDLEVLGQAGLAEHVDRTTVMVVVSLIALIVVGYQAVQWSRSARTEEEASTNHSLMTNLRQMHAEGKISDEEFRNIKSTLTARIRAETPGMSTGPLNTAPPSTGRSDVRGSEAPRPKPKDEESE